MKILIIDRDALACQLISSRLKAKEHEVIVESSKTEALKRLETEDFDIIMIDPLPLNEARPVILGLFKTIRGRFSPYIVLLSKVFEQKDAISAGANDLISKPLDIQKLETMLENAERLLGYCTHLEGEENYSSSGGMIGKTAFNQLFLSAIDRSHRYGERSFVVFIQVENHKELDLIGDNFTNKLTDTIIYMRRQSDVVARVGEYEFAVLLQRPQYESEPFDATTRFTESVSDFLNDDVIKPLGAKISLNMIEVPLGTLHVKNSRP